MSILVIVIALCVLSLFGYVLFTVQEWRSTPHEERAFQLAFRLGPITALTLFALFNL